MFVSKLRIQNFRSLKNATLEPGRHLNFITGQNGAGKTSVIEALFFLSQGKSFKVQLPRAMIRDGETGFSVSAEIIDDAGNANYASVSLGKDGRSLSYNNENNVSVLTVCNAIPVQIVAPDTIDLLLEGPEVRRSYLNWGMFYVHPQFISIYNEFLRYHKQRLSVLMKCKAIIDAGRMVSDELQATLVLYTKRVAEFTDKLIVMYNSYTSELIPVLQQVLHEFLPELKFDIKFYQGWNERFSALENLEQNLGRDMTNGRCYTGLHRFDFVIKCYGEPVQNVLSRGQLKLLACAMKLAQGEHLSDKANNSCVYLVDDLAAELDAEKQLRFARRLIRENNQIFMSYINAKDLEIYRALVKDWHEFKIVDGEVLHLTSDGVTQPQSQTYDNYLNLLGQVEWGDLVDADFEAKIQEIQEHFKSITTLTNQEVITQAHTVFNIDEKTSESNATELATTEAYLTELGMWGDDSYLNDKPVSLTSPSVEVALTAELQNKSIQEPEQISQQQESFQEHNFGASGDKSEDLSVKVAVEEVAQQLLNATSTILEPEKFTNVSSFANSSLPYEVNDFGVGAITQKLHVLEVPKNWHGEEEFANRKNLKTNSLANQSFELNEMMDSYISQGQKRKDLINEVDNLAIPNASPLYLSSDNNTQELLSNKTITPHERHTIEHHKYFSTRANELFREIEITELEVDLDSFVSLTEVGDSSNPVMENLDSQLVKASGNLSTVIEGCVDTTFAQDFSEQLNENQIAVAEFDRSDYLRPNLSSQELKAQQWIEASDLTALFDIEEESCDDGSNHESLNVVHEANIQDLNVSHDNQAEIVQIHSLFQSLTQTSESENVSFDEISSKSLSEEPKLDFHSEENKLALSNAISEETYYNQSASKTKRVVPFWVKRKGK